MSVQTIKPSAGALPASLSATDGPESGRMAADARAVDTWTGSPEVAELARLAASAAIDVQVEPLPHSNGYLIRIVDPVSGKVVQQFPPGGLAEALAELRAREAEKLASRR